jgi:hypothetical protein
MFVDMPMKKSIRNIKLSCRPLPGSSNGEYRADRGWLDDWCESLAKIDTSSLGEASHNPPGLVSIKTAVRFEFMSEQPFTRNYVGTRG